MTSLGMMAKTIRSKNSGPFWITVDIFCDDKISMQKIVQLLHRKKKAIANMYNVKPETVSIFELTEILAVKISFPRAIPQGGALDRDSHAGQAFVPLLNFDLGD
jgi:hypothetical protein